MTDQITARAPISLINEATDNRGQTFTATIEFVSTWFAEPNQKFPAITLKEKTGKITEKWVSGTYNAHCRNENFANAGEFHGIAD